jgi:hypothetical protein
LLIASGVLAILTGMITITAALQALIITTSANRLSCNVGLSSCGDFNGAKIFWTFALILGAIFVVAGVAGCAGMRWGQTALIVLGGIGVLLCPIFGFAGAGAEVLIPLLWFGLIAAMSLAAGFDY